MTNLFYPIVIKELAPEDGGGFMAYAPDLYGCQSDGETREEASLNVQEAICEWVDEMNRLAREIPEPGSAERRGRAAVKQLEDAVMKAADFIAHSAKEMERMRSEYSALQHQFEDLVQRSADEQQSWAMLPAIHPRLKGTDLPH